MPSCRLTRSPKPSRAAGARCRSSTRAAIRHSGPRPPRDGASYVRAIRGGIRGLRIAYAEDLGNVTALDPEVRHAATREARTFRDLGCRLETVAPRWPSPFE